VIRSQSPGDLANTPYTHSYPAPQGSQGNMAPPPLGDPLDPWNSTAVFDHELNLLHPGNRLHPRCHERSNSSAAVRNIDASSQNLQLYKPICTDPNPITRFYNDPEHPWSPQQVSGHFSQNSIEMPNQNHYIRSSAPNFHFHRGSPRSVMSSNAGGRRVDSGYGTKSVLSDSAHSVGPTDQSEDCRSIAGEIHSLHVHPPDNHSYDTASVFSQDPQYGSVNIASDVSPETSSLYPVKCSEPGCKKESKNHSEYKYVTSSRLSLKTTNAAGLESTRHGIPDLISVQSRTVPRTLVPTTIWKDIRSPFTR